MTFRNRQQAGRLLAIELDFLSGKTPLVLALPRGGVPVAFEIARALAAPLDILVVRKLGFPLAPEYAAGAVGEGGALVWNESALERSGLSADDLEGVVKREKQEIQRQQKELRLGREMKSVAGECVILVDDGLATGATMRAGLQVLRQKKVSEIVVAVPVAAADTAQSIRHEVSRLVVLEETEDLGWVARWYQDFSAVSDQEVRRLLKASVFQSRTSSL